MGLSPAAPLDALRRTPMLWDYFAAAGYDTSLFLPDHLEWGDFRRRFEARPGELNLRRVVDAGSSRHPLVYDHSLNDTAVVDDALDYHRQRGWSEPFFTIVSLRMPHATGEGARLNGYDYGPWPHEPPELFNYYNAIRHDDGLMRDVVSAMPGAVRARTLIVVVSDHGTCLFVRRDAGGRALNRLDNDHVEATRVPFLMQLPATARERVDPGVLQVLRDNLARHATSNIDLLPTLLGLIGIEAAPAALAHPELLVGRDLTRAIEPTRAIVQLNTGPLRRWEREHFGLVLEDGARHYLFFMGHAELFDVAADPLETSDRVAEPAFAHALATARGVTAQLPELFRIQQRYAEAR
jgi:membrane-anchored protein YejM (alkaline phosphatase superfamily)